MNEDNIKVGTFDNPKPKFTLFVFTFVIPFIVGMIAFFAYDKPKYFIGITAILLSIILTYILILYVAGSKVTYEINSSGIQKTEGHITTKISWDEEHEVYYDAKLLMLEFIPVGKSIKTIIQAKNNKKFIVEAIPNKYQKKIIEYSTANIFPKMQEKLNNNKKLNFGPIEMDKNNLYIKNKEFKINQLLKIKIDNGKCIFKFQGKIIKTKIKIKEIPNFYTMYNLLIK